MTVPEETFPLGYFYIVSQMNGLVLDIRDPENATVRSKIVMENKKPLSPERDSQLWIHQDGFLTNKASGLVLDINRSESFMAIFTRENRLYLDQMKDAETADDQRFGYDSENGYIYALSDPDIVFDIYHKEETEDARVVVHKRKPVEEAQNQLWTIELADPPRRIDPEDEEEDDGKRERFKAWFGNWKGWHHSKKSEVLAESDLEEANQKVYHEKKHSATYELIAAAVAYQAVKMWEKKQEEEGNEVQHGTAKKLVAAFAAKELVKILQERNDAEEVENDQQKKEWITKMTTSAASNYFDQKHGH
ncbi:hypothetical protein BD560DRAFT_387860 [Blakeslea trispora]|nr:hypothetical protein BD560DRAFT_387860 [Blakeslea trispora]